MPVNGLNLEDVPVVETKVNGVKVAAGGDVEDFHAGVFPIDDGAVGVRVHAIGVTKHLNDLIGLFVGKDEIDTAVNAHARHVVGVAHHPTASPAKDIWIGLSVDHGGYVVRRRGQGNDGVGNTGIRRGRLLNLLRWRRQHGGLGRVALQFRAFLIPNAAAENLVVFVMNFLSPGAGGVPIQHHGAGAALIGGTGDAVEIE